jgi:ATP adenylyltransferase
MFQFEFRLVPHLLRKPITASDAPERHTGQGSNPFLNPDPKFVVSPVGASHLLLMNKFCVYRPSLLLITRHFAPQSDSLDASDLAAAWTVLNHFEQRQILIYNCGYESGSSQGHKHMQLWNYPDERELGFQLFPNQAQSTVDVTSNIPNVPHLHFVLRLPPGADAAFVIQAYAKLYEKVRQAHAKHGTGPAFNVILVKEWICLIPRRHCGLEKGAGANAAAIVGLVWLTNNSEAKRQMWSADYFKYLALPADGS